MLDFFYANGDSMVFGQEMGTQYQKNFYDFTEYHRKMGWTGIISDKLGYKNYMNKSLPGGSNERLHRKTVFNLSESLQKYDAKNMFVLLGTTSPLRKEFYIEDYDNWYPYIVSHVPTDPLHQSIWHSITETNNEKGYYTTDFLHILAVQNFLIKNRIPYLITYGLGGRLEETLRNNYIPKNLRSQLYSKRFYDEMSFWTFSENRCSIRGPVGNHPLEEDHALWAAHILEYINNNNLTCNEDLYELS